MRRFKYEMRKIARGDKKEQWEIDVLQEGYIWPVAVIKVLPDMAKLKKYDGERTDLHLVEKEVESFTGCKLHSSPK